MSPERCFATWPITIKDGDTIRESKLTCLRLSGHLFDHLCKLPDGNFWTFPRHEGFL